MISPSSLIKSCFIVFFRHTCKIIYNLFSSQNDTPIRETTIFNKILLLTFPFYLRYSISGRRKYPDENTCFSAYLDSLQASSAILGAL